ncbi:WD repeat-containing protein 89 [Anthonomus grandis grandis]|uniref:WD repeat-containing protein 89 n=1 Tax=Anthonomus grandis grandis TaxID=2921223 RepID=UPI002165588A|nr:WD repeat-containing protein 89 [Anthonomus grandis grandis]
MENLEFKVDHGESENDPNEGELASEDEINATFSKCEHVCAQSVGPKYILHLAATSDSNPYIAASLSDFSTDLFTLTESKIAKITRFEEHTNRIIGNKFSPRNNNLLYTASSDGSIKVWDLREAKESVFTFSDTTRAENGLLKPLNSFDVSPCDRLLAGGTELVEGDAYILFWDVRKHNLLGAYWESHTDEISQVKFHPESSDKLMSGSTDGLINIYNLEESSEDDALEETLNTECVVEELQWFEEGGTWKVSCITSINDLQLWATDGAEPYKSYLRKQIGEKIKTKSEYIYLARVHPVRGSLMLLCGSNANEGSAFRSLKVMGGNIEKAFQFKENRQRIRASCLNENTSLFLTGGEKGQLDVWKPDLEIMNTKRKP